MVIRHNSDPVMFAVFVVVKHAKLKPKNRDLGGPITKWSGGTKGQTSFGNSYLFMVLLREVSTGSVNGRLRSKSPSRSGVCSSARRHYQKCEIDGPTLERLWNSGSSSLMWFSTRYMKTSWLLYFQHFVATLFKRSILLILSFWRIYFNHWFHDFHI